MRPNLQKVIPHYIFSYGFMRPNLQKVIPHYMFSDECCSFILWLLTSTCKVKVKEKTYQKVENSGKSPRSLLRMFHLLRAVPNFSTKSTHLPDMKKKNISCDISFIKNISRK